MRLIISILVTLPLMRDGNADGAQGFLPAVALAQADSPAEHR